MRSPDALSHLEQLVHQTLAQRRLKGPLILALSGLPGTGKSTLAERAVQCLKRAGVRAAQFSLDDVYLTREAREERARTEHPLMRFRGPPGSHDLSLLHQTLTRLTDATPAARTPIPRFDKSADDRESETSWPVFSGRPDVLLIDNWFWRPEAQTLTALRSPRNHREAAEDPDGRFRSACSQALESNYREVFERAHLHVALNAPSWQASVQFRIEQELKRRGIAPQTQEAARISEEVLWFLQLFERYGGQAPGYHPDLSLDLDAERQVIRAAPRSP